MNYKAHPLPPLQRLYLYGIQGFCDEIIFTSLFDFFFLNKDWSLRGHSSISTFFVYGLCCYVVEKLYVIMYYRLGYRWYARIPVYMLITYAWEFTCGLFLSQFNACPWDYSKYKYNFKGLITLEYAPGWLFLCFMQELLFDYMLRIQVLPQADVTSEQSGSRYYCNGETQDNVKPKFLKRKVVDKKTK